MPTKNLFPCLLCDRSEFWQMKLIIVASEGKLMILNASRMFQLFVKVEYIFCGEIFLENVEKHCNKSRVNIDPNLSELTTQSNKLSWNHRNNKVKHGAVRETTYTRRFNDALCKWAMGFLTWKQSKNIAFIWRH